MSEKKLRLGLIGKDVSKSISQPAHEFILASFGYACEYERFSVAPQEFDGAMRRLLGNFDGFNVTIPYKREVMEYLDSVEGDAFAFGAVNTVVTSSKAGYNTDGMGFLLMVRLAGIAIAGRKILVLGAGGAGRSTAAALKRAGGEVFLYQRNQDKLRETSAELGVTPLSDPEVGGFDILVNATGVGMHDTEGRSPVGAKAFAGAQGAIDLIYEPKESEFLRLAREQGIKTVNGEAMLFYQAYFADCLFLGLEPSDKRAESLYIAYQRK